MLNFIQTAIDQNLPEIIILAICGMIFIVFAYLKLAYRWEARRIRRHRLERHIDNSNHPVGYWKARLAYLEAHGHHYWNKVS